jgi:hypothetical protein
MRRTLLAVAIVAALALVWTAVDMDPVEAAVLAFELWIVWELVA